MKAVALFQGKLKGLVTFSQRERLVTVRGTIKGLKPNSEHGMHIHTYGDLTDNCTNAGSHFNPYDTVHGDRKDNRMNRHVGDLGNIKANGFGVARFEFKDKIISLNMSSRACVIGRGLIVHSKPDDLGRGNNKESLKTGNAGKRLDCAVIGHAKH